MASSFSVSLLLVEVESFDPPKRLILAGRCREDRARNGYGIRRPERSDALLTIYVDVDVEMADFGDAVLRPLSAARAKRIRSDIDVRAVVVLIAQPREIARRNRLLQP